MEEHGAPVSATNKNTQVSGEAHAGDAKRLIYVVAYLTHTGSLALLI